MSEITIASSSSINCASSMNFDNKTVELVAVIPEGLLKCEYKMEGRILVLTVKGESNATIGCSKFSDSRKLLSTLVYFVCRKFALCVSCWLQRLR